MNKESHSSISCKHRTKRKLQSPKRHQSPDLHILQCTAVTLTYRKLIVSLNIYQVHIWQAYYILLRSSIWEALRCMLYATNWITKWRLGAWDIQELSLLAASSWMETSPMAGKSWQSSHEPPPRKVKKAPITLNKQWKEGGKGWGKLPGQWAATPNNAESSC